jgi:hypothetical protein
VNNKELNEEDIQNHTLNDPKDEIMIFYQDKRELYITHYYIKNVLNNPIDPILDSPEICLQHVIKTNKEIKHLL